ncbi:MAG TPA: EAL domain-containing protein [Pantanalinema sp.]
MLDKKLHVSSECAPLTSLHATGGRLLLGFPTDRSLRQVMRHLEGAGQAYHYLEEEQCIWLPVGPGLHRAVMEAFDAALRPEIQEEVRALFLTGSDEPVFTDFARVTSLKDLITRSLSGWLLDLLLEERLTSHFQPIVHAADTSNIFAHEALMRGIEPDGRLAFPNQILALARRADLIDQLDLLARRTAIREARRYGIDRHVFINFNPGGIDDPAVSLRSTVQAVDEAQIPREHVVFELVESDHTRDLAHLKAIVSYWRDAGFSVALDDLGAGHSTLNLLHQLRPDYVKLDMALIRDVHLDPYKALITGKILEIAQQLGIQTVAEGVEVIEELEWIREHGATFVQGYLIARPTLPPVVATPLIPKRQTKSA